MKKQQTETTPRFSITVLTEEKKKKKKVFLLFLPLFLKKTFRSESEFVALIIRLDITYPYSEFYLLI